MALQAVGLQTSIWNNNLRSLFLLGLYPLILIGLVWLVAFTVHFTFLPEMEHTVRFYGSGIYNGPETESFVPRSSLTERSAEPARAATAFVAEYWPAILAVAAVWFLIAFFFHTRMIRMLAHSRPVTRAEEPALYNLLENLCISRGLPVPRLEIIETDALNAFASGINQKSYAITVTRGLLANLQDDEIEAVLGHELTHIMNNDVRLLIISIIFTGLVGFVAQIFWSNLRYNLFLGRRRSGRNSGGIIIVMLAVALILWLGYIATLFTRFALSRRREYMADAGAVELTKNPEAMMRALLRISSNDRIEFATTDIALMCIENSRRFLGLFSTHPPVEKRINTIAEMTDTPVPDLAAMPEPGKRDNPWY